MAKLFTKNQEMDTAKSFPATYASTKGATQEFLIRAKGTAQSTAANVKDIVGNTFTLAKGQRRDKLANTKDLVRFGFKTTRGVTQDKLAQVQDGAQVRLNKALDLLLTGVSIVAALFYENQRRAQQKLKQAQLSLLQTATPIVGRTQDVIVTSTQKASQSLQRAAANARDTRESLQDWYVQYQRRRRRNRTLFRIGLLAGLAIAVFYAPLAGSEVRQRIVARWQQYRSYFEM